MKYLWIGNLINQELKERIQNNGGKILSCYVSSESLYNGLNENGIVCDSINAISVPPYPRYKEKKIGFDEWKADGASHISVGYCNKKYISVLSKRKALVKEAKKWATENKNEDVTVFVYSMHSPFLSAAKEIKKTCKREKTVLIVPDLPQYMDLHMSKVKKALKKIDWINIKRLLKYVDKYVLYSKHMAEFLKIADNSYIVMEGSYDPSLLIEENTENDSGKIAVMYSGVLDLRYGIKELLDAMNILSDRYELWLTGDGNAVSMIKERAKSDSRIKFFGYLPSRKDLLIKQKQATMLISTRNPEEEASAYCFPSKIFEYMISGNPVISTLIKGIPEEYFDYLIPLKNVSPEEIAEVIRSVGEMPDGQRSKIGELGKEFILNKKNNIQQTKNIMDFIGKQ